MKNYDPVLESHKAQMNAMQGVIRRLCQSCGARSVLKNVSIYLPSLYVK